MALISSQDMYFLFGLFALMMILLVWRYAKSESSADSFLVADRIVGIWQGSFSIAVSWIWAPAIFICSMQAYQNGIAGVFWFTLPNILCFFVFAIVAVQFRKKMPQGYTLPQFMSERYGHSKLLHIVYVSVSGGYLLGAVVINAVAGGTLLNIVSGVDVSLAMIAMILIALLYSLLSGLRASIATDVIQMSLVLILGFVIVPWVIWAAGGAKAVTNNLGGITGSYANIFDPWMAFSMGIPMSISLIAGPLSDQMFFQRAMAIKHENIMKVFVRGGLVFGIVPVTLCLLGFVAVELVETQGIQIDDQQMVAPIVIAALLPEFALYLFILAAFAGLCSTMDSAFCGISGLGSIDIYKRYINPASDCKGIISAARFFMVGFAIFASCIALLQPKLLWIFFIYGVLVSSAFVPTIMAVFSKETTGKDVFIGVSLSLVISLPLSFYANFTQNTHLIVLASISSVLVGTFVCIFGQLYNRFGKECFKAEYS